MSMAVNAVNWINRKLRKEIMDDVMELFTPEYIAMTESFLANAGYQRDRTQAYLYGMVNGITDALQYAGIFSDDDNRHLIDSASRAIETWWRKEPENAG